MCLSCAEFSRIQFTTPQKLESLSQLGSQRFPRPGTTRSGLFYTVGAPAATKIWYAPAPVSGVGALVTVGIKVESGPLLAPDVIGAKNLYFERTEALSKNRKLYVAKWSGTAETNDVLAPTPYNAVGFDDYSIAVSSEAKLVYWMSTRNGAPQLLSFASADAAATVSVLDLKVSANCTRAGDDATPWVNSAGTVLLFRSTSLDDDCAPSDSGANDLFAVPLASNGTPLSVAVPLATLNTIGGGSDQTDPAFSADSCVIYYASDSGSGNYDLYRAARK